MSVTCSVLADLQQAPHAPLTTVSVKLVPQDDMENKAQLQSFCSIEMKMGDGGTQLWWYSAVAEYLGGVRT